MVGNASVHAIRDMLNRATDVLLVGKLPSHFSSLLTAAVLCTYDHPPIACMIWPHIKSSHANGTINSTCRILFRQEGLWSRVTHVRQHAAVEVGHDLGHTRACSLRRPVHHHPRGPKHQRYAVSHVEQPRHKDVAVAHQKPAQQTEHTLSILWVTPA